MLRVFDWNEWGSSTLLRSGLGRIKRSGETWVVGNFVLAKGRFGRSFHRKTLTNKKLDIFRAEIDLISGDSLAYRCSSEIYICCCQTGCWLSVTMICRLSKTNDWRFPSWVAQVTFPLHMENVSCFITNQSQYRAQLSASQLNYFFRFDDVWDWHLSSQK